jgi:hypothetical protein
VNYIYVLQKKIFKLILFVALIVFFNSCAQQTDQPPPDSSSNIVQSRSVLAGDFYPGQLEAHYLKHKSEFGDITIEEYLNNARQLLNSASAKDVLEKIRDNGDVLHYRMSTGEFAVMTKDGRIRTYFKTNYRYWLKQ